MKKQLLSMSLLWSVAFVAGAQSVIDDGFESGKASWSARGSESVSLSKDVAHSGTQSLMVSSRSDYWNGASCVVSGIDPGASYDVEAYVYFDGSTFKPASAVTGDVLPLKDVYNEKDYFKFGTCVSGFGINNASTKNMIKTHFNSVTPENELKPDATLNQSASKSVGNNVNPQVQLSSGAKSILQFCSDNNIALRGHCFVWHSQTPSWLFKENFDSNGRNVSKAVMDQRLENYIKNVFELVTKSYPNLNIYAWDVVNEAFNEDGSMRRAGDNNMSPGNSYWMEIYGSDEFIYNAFKYSRKYAPKNCKLYYNDYNEYNAAKRDGIYKIVKNMYEQGICDGVGMQSHLDVGYPGASLYEEAIRKFASIGCDVQITELDVTTTNESSQGTYYKNIFDLYKKYKDNISAVVVWGVNDGSSWRSSKNPLLFNSSNQPKQAYQKIVEGMSVSSNPGAGDAEESLTENSFELCFQYKDASSETQYPTIETVSVPSKTWTKLSGVMKVPADATDVAVYLQSANTGKDSDLVSFYVDDVKCSPANTSSVADGAECQSGYSLLQNVPNPAVGQTDIRFSLREGGFVSIELFNAAGVKVADVVKENLTQGSYVKTIGVESLAPGLYFYEMSVNGFSERKTMIVR